MTKIAIIGFGTVGSGVYEVIRKNASLIEKNAGDKIDIKYILDIRDFSNHEESHLFVNDVNVIAKDDEVKIVVETMGGLEPANTFTRLMLENGKTVVTSNKELVATYGDELFEIAIKNNVSYSVLSLDEEEVHSIYLYVVLFSFVVVFVCIVFEVANQCWYF